jgi:glutamate-5-semialdehyde dehydrogenase
VKAGNAVLLRGGSEAINSNVLLAGIFQDACEDAGLPRSSMEIVPVTDRAAVTAMIHMHNYLDLMVPRGGAELVRLVAGGTVPSLKHERGLCHIYVDGDADLDMAVSVVHNAKVQRPGVCNAVETLLVHRGIAGTALPAIAKDLQAAGVEVRGCPETCRLVPAAVPASEDDWDTEYLDLILSVRVVADLDEALAHIARHSSGLAEAIITRNYERAERFLKEVDSATVYVNASTRFTDGGQFGLGAEIGISTDKLHARGPMSVEELTSTKYVIRGRGQVRA